MGGWKWLGTYHEPWTGGKPNCWWTGLDNPVTETNNPNYLRGSGPKCTSAYNARRQGLYKDDPDRRFSESGDLDDFCKQLKHSFNNNGLNTIAYRNDPSDADEMLYVLEEYPRLHSKTIKTQTSLCKPKWDHYDKGNDEAARKFLLESLQDNLCKRLDGKVKDEDTFAKVFLVFVEMMRPYSTDLFDSIEKKVERIHSKNFGRQSIISVVEQL